MELELGVKALCNRAVKALDTWHIIFVERQP